MDSSMILVIEDDKDIRDNLYELLELEGYQVKVADNGKTALEFLHQSHSRPNLIFLDLMMPVMNGYEFLSSLQNIPELAEIPVIVVSAGREKIDAKIVGFMKKPLDVENVLAAAAKYCRA